MNEPQQTDQQDTGNWLSDQVEIRVSRMLLVAAGLALLVLVGIALD
ncbi:hypothetical protein AADZ90_022335 [Aestuariibius sp. 2305UL40-4]